MENIVVRNNVTILGQGDQPLILHMDLAVIKICGVSLRLHLWTNIRLYYSIM